MAIGDLGLDTSSYIAEVGWFGSGVGSRISEGGDE